MSDSRIGIVASCFDLLHAGHCLMLQDAKNQCDHLIAALHEDPHIERPEKNNPIQTLAERLLVVESNKYVDEVIIYKTEKELQQILEERSPDVRIIGSDWEDKDYTGKNLNIPTHIHERNHSWSTSELRKRIFDRELEK